eukprot:7248318-Pyramimonas_sp.AAC.1
MVLTTLDGRGKASIHNPWHEGPYFPRMYNVAQRVRQSADRALESTCFTPGGKAGKLQATHLCLYLTFPGKNQNRLNRQLLHCRERAPGVS